MRLERGKMAALAGDSKVDVDVETGIVGAGRRLAAGIGDSRSDCLLAMTGTCVEYSIEDAIQSTMAIGLVNL